MAPVRRRVSLREPALLAFSTLRAHKLRSFLTLFGVILSVATLILVIALIHGMNRYIADRVANLGADVFIVHRFGIINGHEEFIKALRRNKRIEFTDYEALRDALKLPVAVGAQSGRRGNVRGATELIEDVSIRGITASVTQMAQEEVASGRHVTAGDDERRATVAFIGADIARRVFPNVDPLQRTILIDGRPFEVIGVAKPIGTVFGQSQDTFIYIPIQTFLKMHGSQSDVTISVQARGPDWMARSQDEARAFMRARRHVPPNEPDNFGIIASDSIMDLWKQLTGTLATAMVGIVSIFLVIGGIVIMNVMLASVTERTREIGIRKSIGARRFDILAQFLVEAAILAAVGGGIGVMIAYVLSFAAAAAWSVPMSVPISAVIISLAISTGVGLFFGIYPARKAARLDPIEALRFET